MMTTLNLSIHKLYIRYLQAHLVLAMASIAQEIVAEARQWDIRGPRCQQCNEHAGVPLVIIRQDGRTALPEWEYIQLDHRKLRRLCYDCLQDLLEVRHMRWWKQVFHGHFILDDPIFQSRISQHLWRSIGFHKCRCGHCEQAWFDRGWTCWG